MNDLRRGTPAFAGSSPMASGFSLHVDAVPGRLTVQGDLDDFTTQLMVITADLLGASATRELVVDLTAVPTLSAPAVAALALLDERQRARRKRLIVLGIRDSWLPALREVRLRCPGRRHVVAITGRTVRTTGHPGTVSLGATAARPPQPAADSRPVRQTPDASS